MRLTGLRQRARELCGWRSHLAELVLRAARTPMVVVPQSSEALDSAVTATLLLRTPSSNSRGRSSRAVCLLDPPQSAEGTAVRRTCWPGRGPLTVLDSKASIRARLQRIVHASDGRAHLSSFALKRVTETFTAIKTG